MHTRDLLRVFDQLALAMQAATSYRDDYRRPAALVNLDIIEEEGLVAKVADFEAGWTKSICALADHPLVEEVRAVGLLGAVEISHEEMEARPGLLEEVVTNARKEGILTRALPSAVYLSPSFVITEKQVDELVSGLSRVLDDVQEEEGTGPMHITPERGGDRLE